MRIAKILATTGITRRTKMANKKNPFSSYYNYPKAWGEAPEGERWHSDPSEQGMTPPWIKDAFGHGTEKQAGSAYTEEQAKAVLREAKESLSKDGSIPKEVVEQLARLRPEDYAGFMGGEDFAEELHSYQQYIGGEFKQRKDGRYEVGSLLLDEGQSPENYLMESAPIIKDRGF